jgi:hypothetical protein
MDEGERKLNDELSLSAFFPVKAAHNNSESRRKPQKKKKKLLGRKTPWLSPCENTTE